MIKRRVLIGWSVLLAIVITVLATFLVWVHNRSFEASVMIEVAPGDSVITLDDKKIKPGSWRVNSGEHRVSFEREGFTAVTKKIIVDRGTYYVGEALVPSDTLHSDWYSTHPEDQKLAENISSHKFDSDNQQVLNNNPWLKDLPYINLEPYFQISYGDSQKYPNDSTKLAIYISANTEEAKKQALEWFSSRKIDTHNLEIIYL